MANLFPPEISFLTRSEGEIKIFNKIKTHGQDLNWSVMHSYNVPNHPFKKWGEIDFIFIIPGKGVVCLEVKDHDEIEYRNREWLFSRKKEKKEDPFKQVSHNSEGLRKTLEKRNPAIRGIPWWHSVVFTSAAFSSGSLPEEINKWEFMDADAFIKSENSFFDFIEKVIDEARKVLIDRGNSWVIQNDDNKAKYRHLREILSAKAVFSLSTMAKSENAEISLALASEEQLQILDLLAQTPRLMVEGLAGTGKTLMATKIAERESFSKKVLFLVFNTKLAKKIKSWQSLNSENITVESIDKFFLSKVNLNVTPNEQKFWDQTLPEHFKEVLKRNNLEEYYDYLVIDEAQDILTKPYKVSALNKLLKGGISEGNWSFFGDFEEQSIYSNLNAEEMIENLHSYCSSKRYIKWDLRKNCRNPIDIGNYAQDYGRISSKYESFLREETRPVEATPYKSTEEQFVKIKDNILKAIEEGFIPKDIVILSMHSLDKKLSKYLKNNSIQIKEYDSEQTDSDIVNFSTISSFKGLESPVIILIGIDDLVKFGSLFYIAMTRATEKLVLLGTREGIVEITNV